jgi:predicted enzyme related to lactoylglutathione lyase
LTRDFGHNHPRRGTWPRATSREEASLILDVPDLDKAIAPAPSSGGTLMRPPGVSAEGLHYAFVKDPDGNQIELVMNPR